MEKTTEYTPPKKSLKAEFYVGFFFILGLLAFGYLAINLANMKFFSSGDQVVKAEFDNVAGLTLGASVELAGVPIGEVTNIALNSTSAVVTMSIKGDYSMRKDDIAAIRTKGIIGDRYIKIIPGGSTEHVANGESLFDTESAVEFEEIIGKLIHKME